VSGRRAATFTDDDHRETLRLWFDCGRSSLEAATRLGIPRTTFSERVRAAKARATAVGQSPVQFAGVTSEPPSSPTRDRADFIGRLEDLLRRNDIDPDDVGKITFEKKYWDAFSKDAEGNPVVTKCEGASFKLSPTFAEGPTWPVVQPSPVVKIKPVPSRPRDPDGWRVAVVLPDIQCGYWRDPLTDELHPTHDEAALSVALQIVTDANPDVVVMLGDNLDFPELGKYRLHPTFYRTTQATIDRATRLMAALRARVRKDCRVAWLAGNHEERLPKYVIDNAAASFGLKRGGAPESWPVLSVPHLCRLDEHDVEFLPGYPANVYRINDNLRCVHGQKVRTNASPAQALLPELRHSTVFGHVHRIEYAAVTRDDNNGPRTYHAVSPGCLCKVNGHVPGVESGYDLEGRPLLTVNNWAQGLLVVPFEPGDGRFRFEQVEIWNGHALWRGREYVAPDGLEEAA